MYVYTNSIWYTCFGHYITHFSIPDISKIQTPCQNHYKMLLNEFKKKKNFWIFCIYGKMWMKKLRGFFRTAVRIFNNSRAFLVCEYGIDCKVQDHFESFLSLSIKGNTAYIWNIMQIEYELFSCWILRINMTFSYSFLFLKKIKFNEYGSLNMLSCYIPIWIEFCIVKNMFYY